MKTLRFTSKLMGLAILALAFSSIASAQATRTWVSGVGDDANPCSRTAPCKTFAGAISKTQQFGEIDCLDPGGFGQVTITKAITIDCDSGPGGILAASGSGVVINSATGPVVLRSVNINCDNLAINGVNIISAPNVRLVDMNIWGCTGSGVTVGASATVFLTVKDSQIHDNASAGISASTSGGLVVADIDHVAIWGGSNGIIAGNAAHLNVHNSTIVLTSIAFNNNAGGGSSSSVINSVLTQNSIAVQSAAGGVVSVSGNVIIGSSPVFNTNTGTIQTGSDNTSVNNGAIGSTNGTPITKI